MPPVRVVWYDGAQMKFTNNADANKYLGEPYQNGWSLEAM
jgi:hypothetical protein